MSNILYVLSGATAVGKDTIINKLKNEYGYEVCISSTTRPMRNGEQNDKDYHFISKEEFLDKLNNNEFLEYRSYEVANKDTWLYGLDKKSVDLSKNQLVILDEKGYYSAVKALGRENVLGIYIYTNKRTEILRALTREPNREDNDYYLELFRRITDDMTAFSNMENDFNVFSIENVELDKAVGKVLDIIESTNIIKRGFKK